MSLNVIISDFKRKILKLSDLTRPHSSLSELLQKVMKETDYDQMIITSKRDAWSDTTSISVKYSCLLELMEIHQFVRQFTLTTLIIYSYM